MNLNEEGLENIASKRENDGSRHFIFSHSILQPTKIKTKVYHLNNLWLDISNTLYLENWSVL